MCLVDSIKSISLLNFLVILILLFPALLIYFLAFNLSSLLKSSKNLFSGVFDSSPDVDLKESFLFLLFDFFPALRFDFYSVLDLGFKFFFNLALLLLLLNPESSTLKCSLSLSLLF